MAHARILLLLLALGGCDSGVDSAADTGAPDSVGGAETGPSGDSGAPDTSESSDTSDSSDTSNPGDTSDSSDTSETGDTAASTDSADSADTAQTVWPSEPIVIYALRHAEKEDEGDDPGLTEEGQARALALVDILHEVPLAAVYASELIRTQETVQPTADDHGLEVITDIDPEDELAPYILASHGGDTVLHCGHSYTLPDFFEELGLDPEPDVDGYGQLWIITIETDGSSSWVETTYGE